MTIFTILFVGVLTATGAGILLGLVISIFMIATNKE